MSNSYIRNLMEMGSHVAFFDWPTLAVETVSAFANAYHETHRANDHTTESHDNIKIDHRDDVGMEHKARDGLGDDDHRQEQSANHTQDAVTDSFDDSRPDRDGPTLSNDQMTTTETGGAEYPSSDGFDRTKETATEQDRGTYASDISQSNHAVADEVQGDDGVAS